MIPAMRRAPDANISGRAPSLQRSSLLFYFYLHTKKNCFYHGNSDFIVLKMNSTIKCRCIWLNECLKEEQERLSVCECENGFECVRVIVKHVSQSFSLQFGTVFSVLFEAPAVSWEAGSDQ